MVTPEGRHVFLHGGEQEILAFLEGQALWKRRSRQNPAFSDAFLPELRTKLSHTTELFELVVATPRAAVGLHVSAWTARVAQLALPAVATGAPIVHRERRTDSTRGAVAAASFEYRGIANGLRALGLSLSPQSSSER